MKNIQWSFKLNFKYLVSSYLVLAASYYLLATSR